MFFFLLYTVLALLIYLYRHRFETFTGRVPYVPFAIENLREHFKKHPSLVFKDVYDKMKSKGPVVGCFFGVYPILLVTDVDFAKRIMVADFEYFTNRGIFYNPKDDPVGSTLFVMEDQKWRGLRHNISPTFSSAKVKAMFGLVKHKSDILNECMEKNSKDPEWDMKNLLARFSADVIAEIGFGLECNGMKEKKNSFVDVGLSYFQQMNEFTLGTMFKSEFPKLARLFKRRRISENLTSFYSAITKKNLEYRTQAKVEKEDFFGFMLKKVNSKRDDELSFDQITSLSMSFFAAGFETTSTTLNYSLYVLAMKQDLQDLVREEISRVLKAHNGEFNYESVLEMNTLEKVVLETLRRYPVASGLIRVAGKDYKVPDSDIFIRKGDRVIIPVQCIHLDENVFENPLEFDINRNHQNLMTFGHGPRKCIAERFAIMKLKAALANFLRSYRISPTEKTPLSIEFDLKYGVLSPAHRFALKVEKINE